MLTITIVGNKSTTERPSFRAQKRKDISSRLASIAQAQLCRAKSRIGPEPAASQRGEASVTPGCGVRNAEGSWELCAEQLQRTDSGSTQHKGKVSFDF